VKIKTINLLKKKKCLDEENFFYIFIRQMIKKLHRDSNRKGRMRGMEPIFPLIIS